MKADEELMSMLMSLRACVFWARASVTAALGFLIMVPRADYWNILLVLVRHKDDTGEFILRMVFSNWEPLTSFAK